MKEKQNKNVTRESVRTRLQELNKILNDPNRYFPDRNKHEALKKEFKELGELYKTLKPTPIESGIITFTLPIKFEDTEKKLTLEQTSSGHWILKKLDWQYGRSTYELILDNKSNLPTKVIQTLISSETYGEPQLFSYDVVLEEPKLHPLIKVEKHFIKPCGVKREGLATLNQDEKYWNSMGLVKDANTGGYRKKTPLEFQAKEIAAKKLTKKKNRTLFGGRFNFKRKKKL